MNRRKFLTFTAAGCALASVAVAGKSAIFSAQKVGNNAALAPASSLPDWGGSRSQSARAVLRAPAAARARTSLALRPPGALNTARFEAACIRCGLCVRACPHDVLRLDSAGLPGFFPAAQPCYLCDDLPCVAACPSGALAPETTPASAGMGTAVVDASTCVAHFGIQCDACYRACPLIDRAISVAYARNERTGKHAMLVPVIDPAQCVGCGCCERACVTDRAAIVVVPFAAVRGERSAHYVRGWEAGDDAVLEHADTSRATDAASAMDYLNGGL